MKTTNGTVGGRRFLPKTDQTCSATNDRKMKCFKSGDDRTTENLGLSSVHTAFLREHNRIADALAQVSFQIN